MTTGTRRFSIKWKLFLVVAVLISAAVLIIVSRTTNIFREDKEAFVKELSAKLAGSTAKNFLNRITTLQDKLIIFISSRESLAHTGARPEDQSQVLFSRYQEFISIGFLSPDASGKLRPDWVMRNPSGVAVKWPQDYEKGFLSQLDMKAVGNNGRAFWRTQGPDGNWLSIIGFSVQVMDVRQAKPPVVPRELPTKGAASISPPTAPVQPTTQTAWIVGVLPSGTFDDLLNDFSTGLNTGFVVDGDGIAIANSDASSRWKNLKSHPLVIEGLKNERSAETTDSKDIDGRNIIGSFEQIPNMNLVAFVTTPRDKAFEAAAVMSRDVYTIGIIILIISLASAILLSNFLTGPLQKLALIAGKIGAGDFKTPVDVVTNDEIGELAESFKIMETGLQERDEKIQSAQTALVQSEKMSAFGQLSAGIAHEVKNPLAGILGHAQLAIGKVQSDDVKKHLEVIEKETRRCKQIVENLMKFARAEKATLVPTDLAQAAQDTINLVDHQLTLAGCKIYKDFQPCPMVDANSNMLQQVLLNLMVNASHAMEGGQTKNVTVRVCQVGKKAQIQVEDTGTGIPPEVQKKMFEPFFTTKPAGKGTGLGLSVSIGIVKDHKGEIYIKSEMGKGTTFFIDIPIPEGSPISSKPLENTHGGLQAPVNANAPKTVAVGSPAPVPKNTGNITAGTNGGMTSSMPFARPGEQSKVGQSKVDQSKVDQAKVDQAKVDQAKVDQAKIVNIVDVKKSDVSKGLPRVGDLSGIHKRPLLDLGMTSAGAPTPSKASGAPLGSMGAKVVPAGPLSAGAAIPSSAIHGGPPPPEDAENPGLPHFGFEDTKGPGSAPTPTVGPTPVPSLAASSLSMSNLSAPLSAPLSSMAAPIPKGEVSELGGKKPVDVTLVNLPVPPEEAGLIDFGTTSASEQATTIGLQTVVGKSAETMTDVAPQEAPTVVQTDTATEFKVKIKRPKLKG